MIGFDITFIGKEVSPALSTVVQPVEEIGGQTVEMIIDKICNKGNTEEKHIILEPRIVIRESTVKTTKSNLIF